MGKKIDSVKLILDHRVEDLRDEIDLRDYFRLEETCVLWVSHAESMGTPLKTTTIEDRKKVAQALVAAMTASFSSFSSFTTDKFLGLVPKVLHGELLFLLTYYDKIMEDAAPLFYRGLPHCLSFIHRYYGNWKSAMSKLRQWDSICSGRRIMFGEGQAFRLAP